LQLRVALLTHLRKQAGTNDDLQDIIRRSAQLLKLSIPDEVIKKIAARSRATPRVANALLKRVRDFSEVHEHKISAELCEAEVGQLPRNIRLLYVTHGSTLDVPVSPVVVSARAKSAATVWQRINTFYADGEFPAEHPIVNQMRRSLS